MSWKPPIVTLIDFEISDETIQTQIEFEKIPSDPIAPAFLMNSNIDLSNIKEADGSFNLHRVLKVNLNVVTFQTYEIDSIFLCTNKKYSYWSQWTPEQLELAQTDPKIWNLKLFHNSDMLGFKQKDGSTIARKLEDVEETREGFVIKDGWDHEHCDICWKTISEHEGFDHHGYVLDYHWICEECYEKYIKSGFGKKLG